MVQIDSGRIKNNVKKLLLILFQGHVSISAYLVSGVNNSLHLQYIIWYTF